MVITHGSRPSHCALLFSFCLGDEDCTGCRVTELLYRCSELRLGDETGKDLMLKCTLTNLE
jgi:hypothetical protein